MQTFKDTNTGNIYEFEDDVVATQDTNGVYSFTNARGAPLDKLPTTLEPYTITDADKLPGVVAAKKAELVAAWAAAAYADISFTTAAGDTATFQADEASQAYILKTAGSYNRRGSVPSGFTWTAADNSQVPFTLDDLNGLYDAILDRAEPTLWNNLQAKKAKVDSIEVDTSLTDGKKITQIQAVTF